MESRAKVFGHSAHQILIVFPLGMLPPALLFHPQFLAWVQPERSEDTMQCIKKFSNNSPPPLIVTMTPLGYI